MRQRHVATSAVNRGVNSKTPRWRMMAALAGAAFVVVARRS